MWQNFIKLSFLIYLLLSIDYTGHAAKKNSGQIDMKCLNTAERCIKNL